MNVSEMRARMLSLSMKISGYKGIVASNKDIYDGLQVRIHQLTMELSNGSYELTDGIDACEGITNKYIKMGILEGLKKKAVLMIEEDVVLQFMISEREAEVADLKRQLKSTTGEEA